MLEGLAALRGARLPSVNPAVREPLPEEPARPPPRTSPTATSTPGGARGDAPDEVYAEFLRRVAEYDERAARAKPPPPPKAPVIVLDLEFSSPGVGSDFVMARAAALIREQPRTPLLVQAYPAEHLSGHVRISGFAAPSFALALLYALPAPLVVRAQWGGRVLDHAGLLAALEGESLV